MSDSDTVKLDIGGQLIRIDRMRERAIKFSAEQRKLSAEADKLVLETRALRIMRWVTPTAAVIGALAALVAAAPTITRFLGG